METALTHHQLAALPADSVHPTSPAAAGRIRRTALSVVLLGAAAFGVAGAVHSGGRHAAAVLLRAPSVPYVLAAVAASAVGLLLAMASWRRLLVDLGSRVGILAGARIHFVGLLGKFIPGPVWGLAVHVQMGRKLGVSGGRMATAFFFNLGVTTLAGTTVGLAVAPSVLGGQAVWLLLPAAAMVVFVCWPGLINWFIGIVVRLVRRPHLAVAASPRAVRHSIALGLASWVVAGLHLWVIAVLLGAPPLRSLPVCIGGFSLAAIAGGFAVIMPDGWGAREVVLMVALATVLPWSAAGVAALASRLVYVLSEIGGAAVAVALSRARDRAASPPVAATALRTAA
jgi:glycosyltransferase 2 family protein